MEIRLLRTAAELDAAARLCYEVYVEECGAMQDAADHERRRLDYGDAVRVLGAFAKGHLVGTVAARLWKDAPFSDFYADAFQVDRLGTVIPRECMAIATRMSVRSNLRGSRLAVGLMSSIYRRLSSWNVRLILVGSQPCLLKLYRSVGFHSFGRLFNEEGGGVMVPLAGLSVDGDHLDRRRSAVRKWIPAESTDPIVATDFRQLIRDDDPIRTPEVLGLLAHGGRVAGVCSFRWRHDVCTG